MLPLEKRYAGGNPEGFHVKVFVQTFFKKFVGVGEAHGSIKNMFVILKICIVTSGDNIAKI